MVIREALIKSGAQIAQQIFRQIVQIERRWAGLSVSPSVTA